ncbi:MAG: ATP-binding protein [Oscillospiraceae bacterium]|nr:ATP-binding protein [Oscillospiraceae bacterium]MCL2278146.1 ATP-binding protein [Oscillospiraceae bacterium]
MKVIRLIKILVATFAVLALANILFSVLAASAGGERVVIGTVSQMVAVLFAIVSVGGAFFILKTVKATTEREKTIKRQRLLYDSIPIPASLWDENFNILDCNEAMVNFLKMPNKEEVLKRFFEFSVDVQSCGTPSPVKGQEIITQALTEGSIVRHYWNHLVEGEIIPIEVTAARIQMGESYVCACYAFDLRPIMVAREKEQLAVERATLLIDSSPISCFLLDDNREAIDCNRAALDLFLKEPDKTIPESYPDNEILQLCKYNHGCKDYELCGREDCRIRIFLISNYRNIFPNYKQNKEQIERSIADCCRKALEFGAQSFEFPCAALYGVEIPCETTIIAVKYHEGNGFAVYIRDLRAEKRKEIAEEESRAKTRFLARMSHEIRTPMNVVIGITELQLRNSKHLPETEEAFLRIYSSSTLLLKIINDILDFSKIEADKMEILSVVYEVASLIVDTVQLNLMHIGSRRIEFKLDIDEKLPAYLVGDEHRLKQILNNLLSNAFKYTSEGHVMLSFSMDATEKSDEITLVIRVSDTGQGMTEEQQGSLFDIEFTRFNMQSNRAIEGSGLGMMIAHHLIKLMGGDIEVESSPDEGSIFTVRIPQKPSGTEVLGKEVADSLKNIEIAQKSLKKVEMLNPEPMPYGRVLVVDDVESNLYVAKSFLMPYKISVETVTSGLEAVDLIRAGEVYDIIFMDHMMPEMDGIEATRLIRSLGYNPPIVALTANALKGVAEIFMNSGFDDFISKPIDVKIFDSCLVRYIKDKHPKDMPHAAISNSGHLHDTGDMSSNLIKSFLLDAHRVAGVLEKLIAELNLKQEVDSEDLKGFTTQTHAIKSALANIHRLELSDAANALEKAGRDNDISKIRADAPLFLAELHNIIEELSSKDDSFSAIDEDLDFLREQLTIIADACGDYNLIAANSALSKLNPMQFSKETNVLIKEISDYLLHGDFMNAAALSSDAVGRL